MKKRKFLFSTKPIMYLTELPFIFLLAVSIYFNGGATGDMKLYPLIITLGLVIIFIFVFLFRYITVSFEEVRCRGLFSSHDSALINKDKTLIVTMRGAGRLRIALYGNDGQPPMFEGLRGEPSIDIYLFRAKAVGGRRTVGSLLRYFGITEADIPSVFSEQKFSGDYEYVSLTSEKIEDIREIRIKIKGTL